MALQLSLLLILVAEALIVGSQMPSEGSKLKHLGPSIVIVPNKNLSTRPLSSNERLVLHASRYLISEADVLGAIYTWTCVDDQQRSITIHGDSEYLLVEPGMLEPASSYVFSVKVETYAVGVLSSSLSVRCGSESDEERSSEVSSIALDTVNGEAQVFENEALGVTARVLADVSIQQIRAAVYKWTITPAHASYPLDLDSLPGVFGLHADLLSFGAPVLHAGESYWVTVEVTLPASNLKNSTSVVTLSAYLDLPVIQGQREYSVSISADSDGMLAVTKPYSFALSLNGPTQLRLEDVAIQWTIIEQRSDVVPTPMQLSFPATRPTLTVPANFLAPSMTYIIVLEVRAPVLGLRALSAERQVSVARRVEAGDLKITQETYSRWFVSVKDTVGETSLQPFKYSFGIRGVGQDDPVVTPLVLDSEEPFLMLDVPKLVTKEVMLEAVVKDALGQIATITRNVRLVNTLDPQLACAELFHCDDSDDEAACDRKSIARFVEDCDPSQPASVKCLQGISVGTLELMDTYASWRACLSNMNPRAVAKGNSHWALRVTLLFSPLLSLSLSVRQAVLVIQDIHHLISRVSLPLLPASHAVSLAAVSRLADIVVDLMQHSVRSARQALGFKSCLPRPIAEKALGVLSAVVAFSNHVCKGPGFYGRKEESETRHSTLQIDRFTIPLTWNPLKSQNVSLPTESEMFGLNQRIASVGIDILAASMLCSDAQDFQSADGTMRVEIYADNMFLVGTRVSPKAEGVSLAAHNTLLTRMASPALHIPLATVPRGNGTDVVVYMSVINQKCSQGCDNLVSPSVRLDLGRPDGSRLITGAWTSPPVMLTMDAEISQPLANFTRCANDALMNGWSDDGALTFHEPLSSSPANSRTCILERIPANFALIRPCGARDRDNRHAAHVTFLTKPSEADSGPAVKAPEVPLMDVTPSVSNDMPAARATKQVRFARAMEGLNLPDFNTQIQWGDFKNLDWLGIMVAGVVVGSIVFTAMIFVLLYHGASARASAYVQSHMPDDVRDNMSESTFTGDEEADDDDLPE